MQAREGPRTRGVTSHSGPRIVTEHADQVARAGVLGESPVAQLAPVLDIGARRVRHSGSGTGTQRLSSEGRVEDREALASRRVGEPRIQGDERKRIGLALRRDHSCR